MRAIRALTLCTLLAASSAEALTFPPNLHYGGQSEGLSIVHPPTHRYHRVQEGECLSTIAAKYNHGSVIGKNEQGQRQYLPDLLARANHLEDPDRIYPGAVLRIPWIVSP